MAKDLSQFVKTKDFLVCVDSDGCAMDTMDIKHIRCFGPCMVREWGLEKWEEEILNRWNQINLYTMTRGINRFKGLALALEEINEKYCPIEGIDALLEWAEISPELSNGALEKAIAADPSAVILSKALSWSQAVNTAINLLPEEEKQPFPLAKEALAFAHGKADVAIVSSANLDAVLEEWEKYGLLEHTDIVLSQNVGSKAYCISELLKKGYAPSHVVMCGDAPGDYEAASRNGVFYYPIQVKKEKESWQAFMDEGFDRLLSGTYAGPYQKELVNAFMKNLSPEK
ncbi:MAG: HAD hydrolase-like protein [Clostridia bacterium]|nr:HAD hydrolase-like protein [Clostridia bacterium]